MPDVEYMKRLAERFERGEVPFLEANDKFEFACDQCGKCCRDRSDKLADGSIPHERRDRRIFRLIWEHKKCMLGRIRAVEEKCHWDDSLSTAYNEVVALGDKMRFIYSKFVIKYSSKDLENIQICLMRMKELEIQLLNVFAEKLLTELDDEKDS